MHPGTSVHRLLVVILAALACISTVLFLWLGARDATLRESSRLIGETSFRDAHTAKDELAIGDEHAGDQAAPGGVWAELLERQPLASAPVADPPGVLFAGRVVERDTFRPVNGLSLPPLAL